MPTPGNASCAIAPPSSRTNHGRTPRRASSATACSAAVPNTSSSQPNDSQTSWAGVKSPLEQGLDRLADPDQAALVVEGAAAPDLAVDDVAAERRRAARSPSTGTTSRCAISTTGRLGARARPVEEQAVGVHPGQLEPLVQQRELPRELVDELVERRGVDALGVAVGDGRDPDQRLQLRDGARQLGARPPSASWRARLVAEAGRGARCQRRPAAAVDDFVDARRARAEEPAAPVSAPVADRDHADRGRGRRGCRTPPARRRPWSGGTPKKQAPSPASVAVCRISRRGHAASMCQNGIGHRASSRSVQPLSCSA